MVKEITENQKLEVCNLISFHGRIKQDEISLLIKRMKECVQKQRVGVIGDVISATYGVERVGNEKIADVEIMLPIDGKIDEVDGFVWKPRICINYAVKLKYIGQPSGFESACGEMNRYIQEKGFTPITVGYIVTKLNEEACNHVSMEVYIGVSPNVL